METKPLTEKQKYWHDHLQRCTDQGIGLADYARQHDLDVNRLYHWKSVLARRSSRVLEKTNTRSAPKTSDTFIRTVIQSSAMIRVVFPNGIVIDFQKTGVREQLFLI